MKTIAELEAQIAEATALLADAESRAASSPSAELSAASLRHHIGDLQGQLKQRKDRRAREIVELRFRGDIASLGSLPLDLFGKIASELANAIGHTARMRRFGFEGRITKNLAQNLDLRLEGIASGSTKLFISGAMDTDLFGYSLLEETLRDAFSFLGAPSPDDLAEAVSRVGPQAANAFQRLLNVVGRSGLALDLSWESPQEEEIFWSAEAWKVRQIAATLSKLITEDPEIVHATGEIITVSARRPFELRGSDGVDYAARVPDELANDIKGFKVGQIVNVVMERQTVRNKITGLDKTTLTLLRVAAV